MRLIDSISLKNAVNAYANEPVKLNDRRWGIKCKAIIADMIGIIEEAPTVDAAPIVRCKDCIHHAIVCEPNCLPRYFCTMFAKREEVDIGFFCACGEKE